MPINSKVKLCGARAKQNNHAPCRQPSIKDKKRCRLHGGLSTGAKTEAGRKKQAQANLKHGRHTKEAIMERARFKQMMKWRDDLDSLDED
jgi:hypothetical protein